MNLNSYATLTALRERLSLFSADIADDARLLARLRMASAQIARFTGRSFAPVVGPRKFDWQGPKTLLFRGLDLLELTSIANGDGSTVDPAAIILLGGVNGPVFGVELDPARAVFTCLASRTRAMTVTGVWGWHDDYANAWRASGDAIQAGGITDTATSFSVANAAGADAWNLAPRFQPGQLLRVDSEYLHLVAVSSNTLTVVRGANGSAAAAHNAGAAISVYVPPPDVTEIALRWAAWLLRLEDSGDYAGALDGVPGMGPLAVPAAIPSDLIARLAGLRQA